MESLLVVIAKLKSARCTMLFARSLGAWVDNAGSLHEFLAVPTYLDWERHGESPPLPLDRGESDTQDEELSRKLPGLRSQDAQRMSANDTPHLHGHHAPRAGLGPAARGRAGLPPPGRRLVFCLYMLNMLYMFL